MCRGMVLGMRAVAIYIVREAVLHLVSDGGGVRAAFSRERREPCCERRRTLRLLAGRVVLSRPRCPVRLAMCRGMVLGMRAVAIYIVREAVSHLVGDGGGVLGGVAAADVTRRRGCRTLHFGRRRLVAAFLLPIEARHTPSYDARCVHGRDLHRT